jgi:mono/diheme cytochrome c family protein
MRRAATALTAVLGVAPLARAESPADSADAAVGQAKFQMFCASCHGVSGDGKGVAAAGLEPPPRDFTVGAFKYGGTDQDIFDVISNGAASKGGSPLMVAWGPVISEAERWALVKFIRSLKK